MTKKLLTDLEKKIDGLQAEESMIESRSTHPGFRDASRRNRIEEEVDALEEASRRDESSVPVAMKFGPFTPSRRI